MLQILSAVECALESGGLIEVNGKVQNFDHAMIASRCFHPQVCRYFGYSDSDIKTPLGHSLSTPGSALNQLIPEVSVSDVQHATKAQWHTEHLRLIDICRHLYDVIFIAMSHVSKSHATETPERMHEAITTYPKAAVEAFLHAADTVTADDMVDVCRCHCVLLASALDAHSALAMGSHVYVKHCMEK